LVLDAVSGAHNLQGWKHSLTNSCGFQIVSLLKLATITEVGVRFLSPLHDGTPIHTAFGTGERNL
jgi:queuine tRNA-ribosyltransferase catalytic subunit